MNDYKQGVMACGCVITNDDIILCARHKVDIFRLTKMTEVTDD